jgi:putative two-component system response regulator
VDKKEKTILIVDDTPENITALSAILSEYGKVKAATNGEKCMKICFSDSKPDLVFLDILMPEMNGWEVLKKLQGDPDTQNIPVIFITAFGDRSDPELAASKGASGFLFKPFDPVKIKEVASKFL